MYLSIAWNENGQIIKKKMKEILNLNAWHTERVKKNKKNVQIKNGKI